MAFIPPKDRTGETSTSNSQTVFAVAGAFDASFNRFNAHMSIGDTTIGYVAEPGVAFRSGKLTYSATNQITIDSTGFESKGTFSSSGTKEVCMGLPAASALMVDGPQSLTATQQARVRDNLGVQKKNYIINGAMMVSQEWGLNSVLSGSYPVDQFSLGGINDGAYAGAQVASLTPAGSPNRLRLAVTTADASVATANLAYIEHRIEGALVADLKLGTASAKNMILQFGVKAPAGIYSIVVFNSSNNRSITLEYVIAGGEANTDVVKSIVIPGDTTGTWLTNNGAGICLRWGLMVGATFAATPGLPYANFNSVGSVNQFNWMGTLGNVFELFDVGLYEGDRAPSFVVPDFDEELARCQRYWQKSYDYGNVIGASTTIGAICGLNASAATESYFGIGRGELRPHMRATPTVTAYSTFNGAAGTAYANNAATNLAVTIITISARGFFAYTSSGAVLAYDIVYFQYKADARL